MTDTIHKLAQKAVSLLNEKDLTVSTAESCTAGLLSASITAVSGASAVFPCGITAYSPEMKHQLLQIPEDVLQQHGTVSTQTAVLMASNVRQNANTALGISVTGVAGPSTSEGKAVGTVHIALADEHRVWCKQLDPLSVPQSREDIRLLAVQTALEMLLQYVQQHPILPAGSMPLYPQPTEAEVVIPEHPAAQSRFLSTVLPWKNDTKKERFRKIAGIIIICSVIAALIYGMYQLITVKGNRSLYSNLQNMYTTEQETVTDNNGILPRFSSLYLQNADIGGWIRVEGTDINYPVMKNAGSNYYANHNFRQQSSNYGVPYFDKNNHLVSANEQNKVFVIYGNNTDDGQMFSDLLQYRHPDFFKEHSIVEMSTLFSAARWQLFAVAVIDPNEINAFPYNRTEFTDTQSFTQHIENLHKRSLVNTDVTVSEDDELLVLVTNAENTYRFDGAVLVIVGKRLAEQDVTINQDIQVTRNQTVIMPRAWVRNQQNTVTQKATVTKQAATTKSTTGTTAKADATTIEMQTTTASTTITTHGSTTIPTTTATDELTDATQLSTDN